LQNYLDFEELARRNNFVQALPVDLAIDLAGVSAAADPPQSKKKRKQVTPSTPHEEEPLVDEDANKRPCTQSPLPSALAEDPQQHPESPSDGEHGLPPTILPNSQLPGEPIAGPEQPRTGSPSPGVHSMPPPPPTDGSHTPNFSNPSDLSSVPPTEIDPSTKESLLAWPVDGVQAMIDMAMKIGENAERLALERLEGAKSAGASPEFVEAAELTLSECVEESAAVKTFTSYLYRFWFEGQHPSNDLVSGLSDNLQRARDHISFSPPAAQAHLKEALCLVLRDETFEKICTAIAHNVCV
jgi:hypothetical protein